MSTIGDIIALEEILLRADTKYRYQYTLNELLKNEKYLKEIGTITNIFLSAQNEYGKRLDKSNKEEYKKKLFEYHNHLVQGEIDYDYSGCFEFIKEINDKYFDNELKDLFNLFKEKRTMEN